ncbi:vitamin B12 ABC transporter ATP-binding protein BtuD [Vibrio sp. SCSIO 43136]|uniref:vitamin B12 ABC transporter ATP-binding protein BtuD n=1 Tax=Vibrio sp. SCSIO 43136 TaxID=2819101 RepID=UPI0020751A03|nr:vitamin B12 ABC transporter ATP-binding protein BtuD [Vibrio sp. SCSIO 43136]USD63981.1 vitamin B12 ABC transporter ATP-binding protein BtuD [Vibrio sp. SCSIO 43136]
MICVKDLQVSNRLLPLSFSLSKGEILHVIGPNGSGKSTLLNAVSGLLDYHGRVEIARQDISRQSLDELSSQRGYLPQQARPAFSISVFHFLSLSIPTNAELDEVERTLKHLCQRLAIADKLDRQVGQLSGGEWQRVRIAAICLQIWPTLNPNSQLLILDEPAAPLDIGQEKLLYDLIDDIAKLGLSIIIANHDLNRALKHADKALLLQKGVMKKFGDKREVLSPQLLSDVYDTHVRCVELEGNPHLIFE